jgi:primosomal protein N' (replication factor Y)
LYARVVVDTGATSPIDSLTYEIPDDLAGQVEIGACVLVPLTSRRVIGYVIGFEDSSPVKDTRPIIAILDGPVRLNAGMIGLAEWISDRYLAPLPRVIMGMLPGVMQGKLKCEVESLEVESDLTPAEFGLLNQIEANGCADVGSLVGDKPTIQRLLRQLEKKGAIRRKWKLIQPGGKPRILKGVRLVPDAPVDLIESLPEKQSEAYSLIAELGRDIAIAELIRRYGLSRASITSLINKGVAEDIEMVFRRDPAFARIDERRVNLTADQRNAVDVITNCIQAGKYTGHLLFGVTASGKTEVYLGSIERALELGKTCLVLLPEIALTTQVMNIFKSRLGSQVAVLHSALSAGERCDEWARISEGEARVVLGARSAVFAPLANLGLIIVDEEHEASYKQDSSPRYNGRDVAIKRAQDANAALVLGSATPSIEAYHAAQNGEYVMLTMASRVENRPMPTVEIANLKDEFAKGKATIFTERLEQGIRERLDRGEQVILLQNRRAYSTFLMCRECGYVARCPHCAVSLKLHAAARKLSCHHCGYEESAPDVCPKCKGLKIRKFGIGTEKVEEAARQSFENARVLRMDRDTTSRKGAHGEILSTFRAGEADILVGTQMIAKGLDFPNVTLVGIISADTSLNMPDFRATERTYQLVSQVAGRAGRGKTPGEVIIQTFDPDNYAIKCAVDHDYVSFFELELQGRRELNYPPFSTLINLTSQDSDNNAAKSALDELNGTIATLPYSLRKSVTIDGPIPAVLSKLKGQYRWHTVMRSAERGAAAGLLRAAFEANPAVRRKLVVDVDPVSML